MTPLNKKEERPSESARRERETEMQLGFFEDSPSNLSFILSSPAPVTMVTTDEKNRTECNRSADRLDGTTEIKKMNKTKRKKRSQKPVCETVHRS